MRRSERLSQIHIHPYVLCIIDMQPVGFENACFILKEVLQLVKDAISEKAFIVVAHFNRCGDTHEEIRQEYCVKDTVRGLSKKFMVPIQVIEKACNGN